MPVNYGNLLMRYRVIEERNEDYKFPCVKRAKVKKVKSKGKKFPHVSTVYIIFSFIATII